MLSLQPLSILVNISQLPPPEGYESLNEYMAGGRCIIFLPLFHIAGVYFSMLVSIMSRNTIVFPLSTVPPTGASLGAILHATPAEWAFIAPTHVEDIVKDPKLLQTVSSDPKTLLYSGGSVPSGTGNVLASHIRMCSYMGSSEFSGFPHLLPKGSGPSNDWAYIHLHPSIKAEF